MYQAYTETLKPIEVESGSVMAVTFDKQPQEIELQQWSKDEQIYNNSLLQDVIELPEEKGKYTFVVLAQWDNVKKPNIYLLWL